MPLSDRIRIDAGRSYTHTLMVRVMTALLLVVFTLAVTKGPSSDMLNTGLQLSVSSQDSRDLSNVYPR